MTRNICDSVTTRRNKRAHVENVYRRQWHPQSYCCGSRVCNKRWLLNREIFSISTKLETVLVLSFSQCRNAKHTDCTHSVLTEHPKFTNLITFRFNDLLIFDNVVLIFDIAIGAIPRSSVFGPNVESIQAVCDSIARWIFVPFSSHSKCEWLSNTRG